jgi:hypothetical protein
MRRVGAFVACVVLAAVVAGCSEYLQYSREGVGTNLDTANSVEVTRLQDAYVGLICQQASLGFIQNADGTLSCQESAMRSPEWGLFVQAGMNDIDRRCDAYLSWLDDQRRSSEPILKELAALSATTIAVLNATGAGVKSLAIVGIAFGLAADTFTNVNKRLLLSVNQSTVESVVLGNQQDFRMKMLTTVVDNRPAAIYLLRSYLRVCTPFYIEASINNTITVYHRAGPEALSKKGSPLTAAPDLAKTLVITNVRESLPDVSTSTQTQAANRLQGQLDAALCVPKTNQTRSAAIRDYLIGAGQVLPTVSSVTLTTKLRVFLQRAVTRVPSCAQSPYLNAFEVGRFGIAPSNARSADIKELQANLRGLLNKSETALPSSGVLDAATRAAISEARVKLGFPPGNEVDVQFLAKISS